ncbi:MAG: extracellular solute-binding protein [Candidatus Omnitrophota bacterium]
MKIGKCRGQKSNKMRKLIYLLTAAFVLVTVSGCGKPAERKNTIVMWHVGPESQARTIVEISREFTERTGINVSCQAISWGDAHSRYLTSIAGGISPDIGSMGLTWGMEFGELGALVDLREKFSEDVGALEKKIFSGILESTRVGKKVFGVPFDFSQHIMYYRTDIIPVPPENWEEFLSVLRVLELEGRGALIDWGSLEWIGYAPFLWQAGGDFYNSSMTQVILDSPEAVKALEYMAELYRSGVPKTQVPLEQGMRTGDYPLAISGNWKIISLLAGAPEIEGKWKIAMLPEGPSGKRTAFIGGRIMSIFSGSKMKEEAWEFIKFLFEPENQLKIYEATFYTEEAYLPPNMDTWALLPMGKDFKEVLEKQAQDSKGPPPVIAWDASTRFINHAIQRVVFKNSDPAVELKKATADMQNELNRSRR